MSPGFGLGKCHALNPEQEVMELKDNVTHLVKRHTFIWHIIHNRYVWLPKVHASCDLNTVTLLTPLMSAYLSF